MNESFYLNNNRHLRWLHEIAFSIYFPFVVISVHEEGTQPWGTKLLFWLVSHGYAAASKAMEDYRADVIDFQLLWLSAFLLFLGLRLFATHFVSRFVLTNVAGFVALAGLPLACIYQRDLSIFSVEAVLVVAGVIVIL